MNMMRSKYVPLIIIYHPVAIRQDLVTHARELLSSIYRLLIPYVGHYNSYVGQYLLHRT